MSEQFSESDQGFPPPSSSAAAAAAGGGPGVPHASSVQMIFEDVDGVPIARLPRDPQSGSPREPDGVRFLSLQQAARRFGRPEATLRNLWRASWAPWLSPADEAAIAGGAAEAVDPSPAADGPAGVPSKLPTAGAAVDQRIRDAVADDLLRQLVCPHLSDEMRALFVEQCRRRRLDPLMNQAIPDVRYDRFRKREVLNVITPIQTFRLIAQRTGRYNGQTRPVWSDREGKWMEVWPHEDRPPYAAAVGVRVKGETEPYWGVVYWQEYAPYCPSEAEPGVMVLDEFWEKRPKLMLSKVAEAAAFRKAFPEELGGLYSSDELRQVDWNGSGGGGGGGGNGGGRRRGGNRLEPRGPIRDNHDYAERTPAAAAAPAAPAGAAGGCPYAEAAGPQVVYDTPTAFSERDAHLALVNMGFCRPEQRQRLTSAFDVRMPGLRSRNPARFWQVLLRDVGRDPSAYGGHAVASPSPA